MGIAGGVISLDYNGQDTGSHSDNAGCDADGTLSGSGNIADGTVHISLTDGSNHELYSGDFHGDFKLDDKTVTGASGTWKMTADRTTNGVIGGTFNGHYSFKLRC